jgi:hypothetical protein
MNFAFHFGRSECVCNHKNRREEGTLNMNFASDLRGMGVGWEGRVAK